MEHKPTNWFEGPKVTFVLEREGDVHAKYRFDSIWPLIPTLIAGAWLFLFLVRTTRPKILHVVQHEQHQQIEGAEMSTKLKVRTPNTASKQDTTSVRLWAAGSFWLFLFVVVFGAISMLLKIGLGFWTTLSAILATEVIIVIIGAFTLRTIEGLSEKSLGISFRSL